MTCSAIAIDDSSRNPTALIVDLDGTLTPTDTLHESIILLAKQSPLNLFRLPLWLLKGRAGFKNAVAAHASFSARYLPYHEHLLAYLRSEREKGRRIILATAAHRSIAASVSSHLGLFDDVLATDADRNLKGRAKLAAIQEAIGGEFVYAGDCVADVPIWKAAKGAVLVGVSSVVAESVRRSVPIEQEFAKEGFGFGVWARAFRVHQWLKNLLLFVPLVTSFSFMEPEKLATLAIAFLAFSFAASATYVANDLCDLENDRAHPRKRFRPLACARISIVQGAVAAGVVFVMALVLAFAVSWEFFQLLLVYLTLTFTYSLFLKGYVLIDVLLLSLLYTLRIFAGAAAIGIAVSSWLLSFSAFTFLSLALLKRCAELVSLEQGNETVSGRDYRVTDLVVLWPLGVGAALSATLVLGLFINAPETKSRYATPELLWLAAIGWFYWLARVWIKASRGEMYDDPVVFAVKDRGSLITIIAMFATMLFAHFVSLGRSL